MSSSQKFTGGDTAWNDGLTPRKTFAPPSVLGLREFTPHLDIAYAALRIAIKPEPKFKDTCYGTVHTSQTQEQQRFAVSKVAADWRELMIPYAVTHCPR